MQFENFEETMTSPLLKNNNKANVSNEEYTIPTWDELSRMYDAKWLQEKEKFHEHLKENFRNLVSNYRSGKQVIFELTDHTYSKHYEQAFRELFADTGYQATIGDV